MGSCVSNVNTTANDEINNALERDKRMFDWTWHMIMVGSCHSYAMDLYTNWKDMDKRNYNDKQKSNHSNKNEVLLYGYVRLINSGVIIPKDICELVLRFISGHILTDINKMDKFKYLLNYDDYDTQFELIYFPLDMNGQLKYTYSFFDYIKALIYVSNISLFDEWIDPHKLTSTKLMSDVALFNRMILQFRFQDYVRILCFTGFDEFKNKLKSININTYNFGKYGFPVPKKYDDTMDIMDVVRSIKKLYSDTMTDEPFALFWHIVSENDRENVSKIRSDIHQIVFQSQRRS